MSYPELRPAIPSYERSRIRLDVGSLSIGSVVSGGTVSYRYNPWGRR